MCVVCVMRGKEQLTIKEAKKALFEIIQQVEDEEEIDHIRRVFTDLMHEEYVMVENGEYDDE